MDKKARLLEQMRGIFGGPAPVQVWQAVVKSVGTTTCFVDILGTDLTDVEVRLVADVEASEWIIPKPAIDSLVLIASINNDIADCYVAMFSELQAYDLMVGDSGIGIDKNGLLLNNGKTSVWVKPNSVTIEQDSTEITLSNGKISIKNSGVSLKGLFDDLATLLQSFSVLCAAPGSPSAPNPTSVAQVNALKAKVATLLA